MHTAWLMLAGQSQSLQSGFLVVTFLDQVVALFWENGRSDCLQKPRSARMFVENPSVEERAQSAPSRRPIEMAGIVGWGRIRPTLDWDHPGLRPP
jgi:hypothetical protein